MRVTGIRIYDGIRILGLRELIALCLWRNTQETSLSCRNTNLPHISCSSWYSYGAILTENITNKKYHKYNVYF